LPIQKEVVIRIRTRSEMLDAVVFTGKWNRAIIYFIA